MPDLLAAYDAQLRDRVPDRLPDGVTVERDGPLVRFFGLFGQDGGGFVCYRGLDGVSDDGVDELIARQVAVFAERGERFEWKLHGHDRPADLPQRLLRAGFVPEDEETVLIAPVDAVASTPLLPDGVSLRELTDRQDLDGIDTLEQAVWGADHRPLGAALAAEREADPDGLTIVVAEAASEIVCASWVRFEHGTDFATLWGGATLPAWRGRGIYRATVAYRAGLAAERGFRYVEVDASSDSRPILERLGFVPVTTTTPYVWSPARTSA
ncbi:MAG TPA: GNAT family N-acetyltransferase [Gaiellaceae bacterium]|nr:GNAT family N-acetyltransferase [Gaiellaceae bacterium]